MAKIMLVDDDVTIISLLKTWLVIDGYEVVTFQGEEDILQVVRREKPDLILLDVNLKNFGVDDFTGFDLLKRVRVDNEMKKIGVIMSSGMNYRQESEEAGANGFVLKPYMPDDLLELIKNTISKN